MYAAQIRGGTELGFRLQSSELLETSLLEQLIAEMEQTISLQVVIAQQFTLSHVLCYEKLAPSILVLHISNCW